ncbi:MAG: M4 family metallopeptidase, partial [Bacteroidota bacterium]|nr:M4 family metallopeptidase [Bacteroidota bacterium]
MELGGYAWEKAGRIWYRTLCEALDQSSDFQAAANLSYQVAGDLYGKNSTEQKAVYNGWKAVGIVPASDGQRGCRGFVRGIWRRIFG